MARPTDYKPEYDEQAKKLCLLGATDREIADFFGCDERTLNRWKEKHDSFAIALKTAKAEADSRVVESLYRRALGYEHDEMHITAYEGEVIQTPITKHYPPDTVACIFWLKNRQPEAWRDVKAVEHSGSINHKHATELTEAEIDQRLRAIEDRRRGRGGAAEGTAPTTPSTH